MALWVRPAETAPYMLGQQRSTSPVGHARSLRREVVRVPFRWGSANTGRATGSTELGAVSVAVTR